MLEDKGFRKTKNNIGVIAKTQTRWFVIFGLAGVGGIIVGLYVDLPGIQRYLESNEVQVQSNKAQVQSDKIQIQSNQEAFNQAITHLGNTASASARLGGVYGLYDLLNLEPERLPSIVDILCFHLRETTQQEKYINEYEKNPSNEVQSLLNILGRINKEFNRSDPDIPLLDLSEAYLVGANLKDLDLHGANLHFVRLQGASLWDAQLQGADLRGAQLQGAGLFGARLQGANLHFARLQGADLFGAQLQGADLWYAWLQGARLRYARLQGADLSGVQLQGADLRDVQLQGAFSEKNYRRKGNNLEERINRVRGKETSLNSTLFGGRIKKSELNEIESNLKEYGTPGQEVRKVIDRIKHHVGKDANYILPPKSGAITGTLTDEMVDEIIADYKESLKLEFINPEIQ